MPAIELTVGYRPIRIGWCVREVDLDDLRRAWRLTHTLWGGKFNPLIPVGLRCSKDIIRALGVDVLLPADGSCQELLDFAKSFDTLYWPEVRVFPDGPRSESPTFVDVKRPIELIREMREKERAVHRHAYLFEPNAMDPLKDVLLAMFGGYPEAAEVGVDYSTVYASTLRAETIGTAVMGPEIATALTPSEVSSWEIKRYNPH